MSQKKNVVHRTSNPRAGLQFKKSLSGHVFWSLGVKNHKKKKLHHS